MEDEISISDVVIKKTENDNGKSNSVFIVTGKRK